MDEVWERAVETALDGQTDCSSARALTLDGAVKCIHGRLPPPGLLERFKSLEHLSIANVGVSSLEKFPRLPNLQKLILSDNRIAGGLEFLVQAGLASLRDLDLSNNRIQYVEDLAPLAQLKLVSLDLYECPVTRVKDYRSMVFGMIRSLKYLDKMDADENERPESDEEDDDDEEDEEEDDDPGSGEVDGEDRSGKLINGGVSEGIIDADEDEESDADEEEMETGRAEGLHPLSNGFRVAAAAAPASGDGDEAEEDLEDEENDLGEEIDEEEGDDDEDDDDDDVVEVHEIDDSEDEEDGVEEDEGEDEEDVEDEEEEDIEPMSTGRLTSAEGEIDGHEQGEEDENGEIGEEDEQGVEEDGEYEEDDNNGEVGEEDEQGLEEEVEYEDDDEEEDIGSEYLVQPIGQAEEAGGSDLDPGNEEEEEEEEEVEDEEVDHNRAQFQQQPPQLKRRSDASNDRDSVEDSRPSKESKHH